MGRYKSILQKDTNICALCSGWIAEGSGHNHHVMNGRAYRMKSQQDGLMLYLHPSCHRKVHDNAYVQKELKKYAQGVMMNEHGWSLEDWIERYGKSYLED